MRSNLEGDVILVTGAAGGLGQAMCEALSDAGAQVIATDLAEPSGVVAELTLQHDVTSADSWCTVRQAVGDRFGVLHGLVNNAGRSHTMKLEDLPIDEWRSLQAVNVESVFHSLRIFLPLLRRGGEGRDGGASVVNISSIAGLRAAQFNAAYGATKAAVRLLTKSAAIEFATLGYPIRVNSIHPGAIETKMVDTIYTRNVALGLVETAEAARARMVAYSPMGRLGKPKEIAAAVVFLCSTSSSFTTGAEFVADGGTTSR